MMALTCLRCSGGPLHRIRSNKNPSTASSESTAAHKKNPSDASSLNYRRINSVDMRQHILFAVTVLPQRAHKNVDTRALVPCRINLIINAILAIIGAAALSKIGRSDFEHLRRSRQILNHESQQKIIRMSNVNASTPLCICGTSSPGQVAVIGYQRDRSRPLAIDQVASSDYDREVTSAASSSVHKRRSAQRRDGVLRSRRQRTILN